MDSARPNLFVLYEVEPPGPPLLAQLALYEVELLPARELSQGKMAAADWRRYSAILIFAPASLPQGRDLCKRVRWCTDAPILLIAPLDAPEDASIVLQESADVLLTFDTDPTIVAGHIGALLRRWQGSYAAEPALPTAPLAGYRDALLEVDLARRSVRVAGQLIHLTPTEYRFLAVLVQHPGELLPYDQILHAIWGWRPAENRVVHTFAAQVRSKLGARAAQYIVNEYGSGYRFSPAKR